MDEENLTTADEQPPETGRSSSLWIGVGITATPEEARRRRLSKQRESVELSALAPGTRVMFLLKEKEETPAIFTEMGELSDKEWRETARWVKFEEDVEQGGNRWSKPHVATLSLHSLFELRNCLQHGIFMKDLDAPDLDGIYDAIVEEIMGTGRIILENKEELQEVLRRRHVHQYEQAKKNGPAGDKTGFLSTVRSISDIGRSLSHGRNLGKTEDRPIQAASSANLELPKVDSMPKDMQKDGSSLDISKGNTHFLKKLPHGVEASNVLVGEVDFLTQHVCVFVRLKNASILGDLTEVPVPTRFIFLLLGPRGNGPNYREIGRAIATLMADEIFHMVAFNANHADDLLAGVDEFLDQATVLPPGEWDPNIRIEPPNKLPSQEKRKQQGKELLFNLENIEPPKKEKLEEDEEDGHGNDPALKRTGKLFGGLVLDIKRKAPHYFSDFTDAFNMQCVATICFMFFALLAPIVTFGGLLEEATHQRMAAMENLFGGAICGIIYHLFSGQPLTIIGSTGPVLVFETIVFDICTRIGIDYLSFRLWIYLWTAGIIFFCVATDASSLVSYITRFTEESFATLIAVIFIYEAIMKLWKIKGQLDVINYSRSVQNGTCFCVFPDHPKVPFSKASDLITKSGWNIPHNSTFIDYTKASLSQCTAIGGAFEGTSCYLLWDKLLMSICLAVGTFFFATTLKKMRNSCYFPSKVRQIASDFAVMIAICIMTSIDMLIGINTPKLNVPSSFRPTWEGRGWFIPPFGDNPYWTAPVAIIPALLASILIFMDQQITTVIVNRKENKLKKGCGYHLDLMVLSFLIILNAFMGLPVFVAATVLAINHINSLKVESECRAPGEVPQFVGVREQRITGIVTFIFIGCSVMFTKVLGHIPMPVLYGVFLYMGISALGGIQMFDRILLFLMPMKYQPDTIYIRHVPIKRIHLFTICQVICFALLWTIKSIKITSIFFPVMLVAIVGARKLIEVFIFTKTELKYLDDPMPEFHLRKKEDMKRRQSEAAEAGELEIEENQATIHAVKTEAHLHIPMASGNVIKIPLAAIQEPSHSINMTKEVNSSGIYKHIQYNDSKASLGSPRSQGSTAKESNAPLETPEEDEDAIMIKVIRPSPHGSNTNLSESQPLLKDKEQPPPV